MITDNIFNVIAVFVYIFLAICILNSNTNNKITRIYFGICVSYAILNIFYLTNAFQDVETTYISHYFTIAYRLVMTIIVYLFFEIICQFASKKIAISNKFKISMRVLVVANIVPFFYLIIMDMFKTDNTIIEFVDNFYTSILFYANSTFYILILSSCILLIFSTYQSTKGAEKKSVNFIMYSMFIYSILIFYLDFMMPRMFLVSILSYSTITALIPLSVMLYTFKKYNYMFIFKDDLIKNTILDLPVAICLIYRGKLCYVNKKFLDLTNYSKAEKIIGLSAKNCLTDKILEAKKDCVVSDLKNHSPQNTNKYYCQKQILKNNITMISIYDITFIENDKQKLQALNEHLNSIVKESTKKLYDLNDTLKRQIRLRIDKEQAMLQASTVDPMTGLYAKDYFLQVCHDILKNSNKYIDRHVMIYLDLDNFKNINDALGHSIGDMVLSKIATKIQKTMPKDSIACRIGGDEFLIFVKNDNSEPNELMENLAIKLTNSFKPPIDVDGKIIATSASIGLCCYPDDGTALEKLIRNASSAMYKAKEQGMGLFSKYEKTDNSIGKIDYELMKDIAPALERNEFTMYYHPIVKFDDDSTFRIIGFESLLRWFHHKKGKLSPTIFIPIAERTNYISDLTEWTVKHVCTQLSKWNGEKNKDYTLSLNLTYEKFDLYTVINIIKTYKDKYGVNPERIVLELPEVYMVKTFRTLKKDLDSLKDLGIKILIDDFGTYYSSLKYLKYLPIDMIKVNSSFINGIGRNKKDEAIIISLIKLSKNSNIDIIAEAVETKQQCDFLIKHGLKTMQGFYFYEPMDIEHTNELINRQYITEIKH